MAMEELTRTNIQALWRYMPGQPFNWSSTVSVQGETPRQVSTLDVPEAWVAPQLRRLIAPFAEAASGTPGVGPELEVIERGQFELVRAEDLRATRFPNTFHCRACGRFIKVRAGERAPACPDHGPMRQFTFVEVHECGHMAELTAPRCANNCHAPMGLFNTASFSTSQWYWRCLRCSTRSDQYLMRWCASCRTGRVTVMRVPQTSAYYPQQITVINPPTRATYASIAHEHVYAAAVAQSLGVLPSGLEGLRLAVGAGDDTVTEFLKVAATIGWTTGNPMYDQGLADAKAKAGSAPAWRDQVDALGLDPETVDAFGEECRQLSLAGDAASMSVEDLVAESPGSPLEPTYRQLRPLFTKYGLEDVTLLRQLPISFVVAGYTRSQSKATAVARNGQIHTARFRFFPAGKSSRFRMYGVRAETEGLLFRLDRVEVVRWLVDSGIVADPGVSTPEEAQAWLMTVTDPVTDIFNAPENRISAAVLGLTHSMAHRAMKALASRCGLNVDSLAEYLFPANAAFLLYANTHSEFVLGGVEHVFRYDLGDALRELDAESRCVFDPPCRHAFGGACAACLYVSEVACSRFNTVLDRNLLFGSVPLPTTGSAPGPDPAEVTWRAFWNR
jgi:hypothetical protein